MGDLEDAAVGLLGARLSHAGVTVRVTEVEAYGGPDDPASHAARGPTARNATMFGPAGRLYVYRSYGLHWCANVVVAPEGLPGAVLLRAGEVVAGLPLARERRGTTDRDLARGPGRLCAALGLTGGHDGADFGPGSPVRLELPGPSGPPSAVVARGPRVGVSVAADVHRRWWLRDDRYVSDYRRSPRAPRPDVGRG